MPAFVLLARARGDDDAAAGFGITATKKLGNAVARNRVKRRFRALIRDQFPAHALPYTDYVVIGRNDALTLEHDRLASDLVKALAKAQRRLAAKEFPERDGADTKR